MAIGPVQLIVLGFEHPDFHGEIIAELERLRESDTVRVIDALAVHKDAQGEIEVLHLSNLTKDEAIELGTKIGALIGLGHRGRGGPRGGRDRRRPGRRRRHQRLRRGRGLGHHRGDPQRLGRGPASDRAPLGGAAAQRDRPRGRLSDLGRLHQPPRPDRDRPGQRRGGRPGPRDREPRGGRMSAAPPPPRKEAHDDGRPQGRAPHLATRRAPQVGNRRRAPPCRGARHRLARAAEVLPGNRQEAR